MTSRQTAIYARISSDDGTALGVARQVQDCEELARRQGWEALRRFVDNDVSASSGARRPEFERMLGDIRAGSIGSVVVWDIDRLTRTPAELEEFILLADTHRLDLASVGGEVDLGTPQGRLTARIKGSVARHEVEQQSRRLRRKFLERAQEGKPHGKVAYGYRRQAVFDDQGRQIGSVDVLHNEQAAVIRDAARRVLALEPVRRVVADLNARGVPTPRGNAWDGTMLRQVLLRERNAGRRVHRGEVIGPGDWPAILDDDTFDRLCALLSDPSRVTTRGNAVQHLLSGIARCGIDGCEGTMRVTLARMNGTKQAPTSYNCRVCHRIRRKKADVDEVVESLVVARLSLPDGPDLLAGDPVALQEARESAAAVKARLELAADSFAEGNITADQLTRITAKLRPQLEAQERRARAAAPSPELERFVQGEVADAWKRADIEIKRAVINMLMTVTLVPTGSGGRFDPESVKIEWKGGADAAG